MKANLSEGKERDPVFPFPRVRDQLQPYRHRSPVIVALEPKPEPERLQWWEAAHQPVAESGATLILIAPATVTSDRVICFGDPRLLPSALESPEVWILDAYLIWSPGPVWMPRAWIQACWVGCWPGWRGFSTNARSEARRNGLVGRSPLPERRGWPCASSLEAMSAPT